MQMCFDITMTLARCTWVSKVRSLALVFSIVFIHGCASPPTMTNAPLTTHLETYGPQQQCAELFVAFDDEVFEAQIQEIGAEIVSGFPYLRVNRYLASFSSELGDPVVYSAWVNAMRDLDRSARKLEWARLSESSKRKVTDYAHDNDVLAKLDWCAKQLMTQDFLTLDNREILADRAFIDDEYVDTYRWLGLFPVSKYIVGWRVNAWREKASQEYGGAVSGMLREPVLYRVNKEHQFKPKSSRKAQAVEFDALGAPIVSDEKLMELMVTHAPDWSVVTKSDADKIGAIKHAGNEWGVDATKPTVYFSQSFTRFRKHTYLQLNYVVWFSERPKAKMFDIFSGNLDGLIWRVTLDHNFEPMFYDSIHTCGCYHYVFNSPDYTPKAVDQPDWPVVVQAPELFTPGAQLNITVSSGDHQIIKVSLKDSSATAYSELEIRPYHDLQAIAVPNGVTSLFDSNGIVKGTSRRESWFLWPMGVRDTGAMRALGTHAIAFTTKRHFDDAFLFENWFRRVQLKRE